MGDFAADVTQIAESAADPPAIALTGQTYTKAVAAVTQLFYRASDGTVYQLTPPVGAASGWTDDGTVVRLTTITDRVGVGVLVPTGLAKMEVMATVFGPDTFTGVRSSILTSGARAFDVIVPAEGIQPRVRISGTTIEMGPGGASAPDVNFTRNAATGFWETNVGFRFGGNIERHEANWIIRTVRTVAGIGPNLTVRASDGVVTALNTANAGGEARFASGDTVISGVAALAGRSTYIEGGSAASSGAGVNGGDVIIVPGAAAGAGPGAVAGSIVSQNKTATAAVNFVPAIDSTGAIGTTSSPVRRWSSISVLTATANNVRMPESADPVAIANTGITYTKDDGGVTQLFYRASDGTVSQLTPPAASAGGWTDDGAIVRLTTAADTVAIGAAVMSGTEKLRVVGDVLVNGKVTATEGVFGDVHLRSDARDAHWIIREESDRITVINAKTGKKYRIPLVEED